MQPCALGWTTAGGLHVGRAAGTEAPTLGLNFCFEGRPAVRLGQLQRLLQDLGIVAGLVDDRHAIALRHTLWVGHLLRLYKVATTDLEGIEAQLPSGDVDSSL